MNIYFIVLFYIIHEYMQERLYRYSNKIEDLSASFVEQDNS